MQVNGHDIAVCSWSLQPTGMEQLVKLVREVGLSHVQLALRPILALDEQQKQRELARLRDSGLSLTAAMIDFPGEDYSSIARIRVTGGLVPDDAWTLRKQWCFRSGQLCQELGVKLLTFHVGFIPPSNHEDYPKMIRRVSEVAGELDKVGVGLGMETGQEGASEMLQFLNDLPVRNVGINFDPANMLLYGAGEAIEAIGTLGRHIRHVHAKDAIASKKPGLDWGTEIPFGQGEVDGGQFLAALREVGYQGPIAVECEVGSQRVIDVKSAVAALLSWDQP